MQDDFEKKLSEIAKKIRAPLAPPWGCAGLLLYGLLPGSVYAAPAISRKGGGCLRWGQDPTLQMNANFRVPAVGLRGVAIVWVVAGWRIRRPCNLTKGGRCLRWGQDPTLQMNANFRVSVGRGLGPAVGVCGGCYCMGCCRAACTPPLQSHERGAGACGGVKTPPYKRTQISGYPPWGCTGIVIAWVVAGWRIRRPCNLTKGGGCLRWGQDPTLQADANFRVPVGRGLGHAVARIKKNPPAETGGVNCDPTGISRALSHSPLDCGNRPGRKTAGRAFRFPYVGPNRMDIKKNILLP